MKPDPMKASARRRLREHLRTRDGTDRGQVWRLSGLTFLCAHRERLNVRETDKKLVEAGSGKVAGVMLDRDIDEFEDLGLNQVTVGELSTCNAGTAFYDAERRVEYDMPGREGFARAE